MVQERLACRFSGVRSPPKLRSGPVAGQEQVLDNVWLRFVRDRGHLRAAPLRPIAPVEVWPRLFAAFELASVCPNVLRVIG